MISFRVPLACALLSASGLSLAATFTVDTTSDASLTSCTAAAADCSLRGAIFRASGAADADTVAFAIPASDAGCNATTGVCRISVLTNPEAMFENLLVDGYTQPGAVPNSLTPAQGGSNAILKIEVHGGNCTGCNSGGFRMGNNTTIRGLVINGFAVNGINVGDFFFSFAGSNTRIEGNFIGTDATGTVAIPNQGGIGISGGSNRSINVVIGGSMPAARNLISGNTQRGIASAGNTVGIHGNLIGTNAAGTAALPNGLEGIVVANCGFGSGEHGQIGGASMEARNLISGNLGSAISIGTPNGGCGSALDHRILGNFIGTDFTGTLPIPNGRGASGNETNAAIRLATGGIAGNANVVGGLALNEGNLIAFAPGMAVTMPAFEGFAQVVGNRMFGNGGLGIDAFFPSGGRTLNDPGDADTTNAPNVGLQNFPEISAATVGATSASITYRVDSAVANSRYPIRVDFYEAAGDEGRTFLGSDMYAEATAQMPKSIALAYPAFVSLAAGAQIVATAVDAELNQSEFNFYPTTVAIATPAASPCVSGDSIFCNGFEDGAQASISVRVTATATAGPFAPSGRMRLSDDRGASCDFLLAPTGQPLQSGGSCVLANSGAAGAIAITARLGSFESAFAASDGSDARATATFTLP